MCCWLLHAIICNILGKLQLIIGDWSIRSTLQYSLWSERVCSISCDQYKYTVRSTLILSAPLTPLGSQLFLSVVSSFALNCSLRVMCHVVRTSSDWSRGSKCYHVGCQGDHVITLTTCTCSCHYVMSCWANVLIIWQSTCSVYYTRRSRLLSRLTKPII